MSIEYTRHTLQDIEIKLHEARRRLEGMLAVSKFGVIPKDNELVELHTDLVNMVAMLSDYYIQYLNNFKNIEEIVIEEPKSNIIPLFPNKED